VPEAAFPEDAPGHGDDQASHRVHSVSGPDRPPPPYPAPEAPEGAMPSASRLIVAGYILAVVFPIVGFVIGVVLVNRSDKREIRHGIWMIAISVLTAFILFVGLTVVSHGSGSEEEDNVRAPSLLAFGPREQPEVEAHPDQSRFSRISFARDQLPGATTR
jgi:hypothetical protein